MRHGNVIVNIQYFQALNSNKWNAVSTSIILTQFSVNTKYKNIIWNKSEYSPQKPQSIGICDSVKVELLFNTY